ncbi:hypothetical protein FOZ76_26220 [Verticiella sediminum]|uniref:Uncharacterized protein n=1 Tax=Verticiella sediminum TaxID=1247510 RepID=A0A556A893_9BURK|nr:hypothetical protein [Verticiella sediminum]TSH89107.1 hypothetical protein FOZ76_26220 [Verticiella sediminum]
MFRPNNPDIDFPGLQAAVLRAAGTRRNTDVPPLVDTPAALEAEADTPSASGWRARLRAVPVLGGVLAYTRRGLLAATAPGISPRARVRALPFLGGALGWLHAWATLPRWRRQLRDEVQVLREQRHAMQRELDELRRAQGDLLRDMGRLRVTLAERQRGEPARRSF